MRFSFLFVFALPSFVAFALPVRRDASPDEADNILVFQFADILNHLENQFYTQALSQFQESDFEQAGFSYSQLAVQLLQGITSDESTHFQFLESSLLAIGGSPISGCNFDFSSVLTDVNTMLDTARVVENVGVGAFLGGATLLTDNVILDAAASILTVEARHQTILNVLNTGSAVPQSFDIPLSPSEVLAIAGPFISGCSLGIPANPSLTITNTGTISSGTQLSFSSPAINGSTDSLFCQILIGGQPTSYSMYVDECTVPEGLNGPAVVFVTNSLQPLVNNVIDRAASEIVAGPAMFFVDSQSQLLGELARSGDNTNSVAEDPASNPSTTTISGSDVQSIIQSISATATATASGSASTSTSTSSSSPASSSASSPSSGPSGNGSALPGENTTQGPVDGGAVIVNGWETVTTVPAPAAVPSAN